MSGVRAFVEFVIARRQGGQIRGRARRRDAPTAAEAAAGRCPYASIVPDAKVTRDLESNMALAPDRIRRA